MSDERLTDGERQYLDHIIRWGSDGYPIAKIGGKWWHNKMYGVGGAPIPFKTKREASAHVELYCSILRDKNAGRL